MPTKVNQFIAAILFLIVLFAGIGYYRFTTKITQINEAIDAKLLRSAKLGEMFVGDSFHDTVQHETPTAYEHNQTMKSLSSLAKIEGVVYIYSMVMDENNTLHFTSSSAKDEELQTGEGLSYFYDIYDDNDQMKQSIRETIINYDTYSDQWGSFRSIFVGNITPNGVRYCIGADVSVDYIAIVVRDAMLKEMAIGFLWLLSIAPLIFLYRTILHQNKQELLEQIQEATRDLASSRDEAVAANRAKDTFLSNMSHELRTPLNAINGFSQVLLARADTPEKVKVFLEKIYISGLHLLSLVNTLLDFAKIESGKTELFLASSSVSKVFDDVEMLLSPSLDEKKLRLIKKIDQEIFVTADHQLLKQVLINLVSNAIKFSPKGEKILISCQQDEEKTIFAVIDHGYGIVPDKIATVFDPFVQVREAQNDSIKGTGLGLSIVKKIVELHGGEVWLKSTQGKGSAFYFSLPTSVGITSVD